MGRHAFTRHSCGRLRQEPDFGGPFYLPCTRPLLCFFVPLLSASTRRNRTVQLPPLSKGRPKFFAAVASVRSQDEDAIGRLGSPSTAKNFSEKFDEIVLKQREKKAERAPKKSTKRRNTKEKKEERGEGQERHTS